jgi:Tfp pilus assembly protein PilV
MSYLAFAHAAARRSQRGAALLESLIAFVFLAIAAMSAAQLQGHLRLHADLARQRSQAVHLGQRELEMLRAWSTPAAASGSSSYAGIVDADRIADADAADASNADYRIVRHIDDAAFAGAKSTSVAVEWSDRSGATQRVVLDSVIARSDPAWSGALALGGGASAPRGAHGRAPAVPVMAKSIGGGRSALKLAAAGSTAIVFDDATGNAVSRCTGVALTTATRDLTTSDLSSCSAGAWLVLSGTIRFTSAVPPLPSQASETPPTLAVALALTGGSYTAAPDCNTEAMKTVRYTAGGSLRIDAVPIDALPASLGLSSWNDTGDRFVSYRCLVTPRADGRWSGRSTIVAAGWTIGTGSADRRVCRYAADRDGSGAIDANIEHPADYAGVAGTLQGQNFIVVRGDQNCPGAPDASLLAAATGTVQHQP